MKQLVVILLLLSTAVHGQIEGLWQYDKVLVGKEEMTPVAKWSDFNSDGTFDSGNGWTQNATGFWEYDSENNTIILVTEYTPKDEFGPFDVEIVDQQSMIWKRMEEGMSVKVFLSRAVEKPKSNADWVIGLWREKEKDHVLHVRWDKNFRKIKDGKRETGYWVFHAHKPEIAFIPHDPSQKMSWWSVVVNGRMLQITNVHTNEEVNYTRLEHFPN